MPWNLAFSQMEVAFLRVTLIWSGFRGIFRSQQHGKIYQDQNQELPDCLFWQPLPQPEPNQELLAELPALPPLSEDSDPWCLKGMMSLCAGPSAPYPGCWPGMTTRQKAVSWEDLNWLHPTSPLGHLGMSQAGILNHGLTTTKYLWEQ